MTQVVIDDIIPRTQLISAANQTVFNTNWTADEATDIDVYARALDVEPDDATQLVSPTLYNVTFIGGSQIVRVTFLSGRELGDVITIVRNTPSERLNLYTNTNFVPSMLNNDFGILTLVDQQSQMYDTVINPGYNVSATIDNKDKVLPILGPQQVWRMNEDNTGFEPFTIDTTPSPSNSYYITYGEDPTLENEQNLGLLGDGLLKQTVSAGFATLAIAIPGVDYLAPGSGLGTMAFQDADNVNITGGFAALGSGSVSSTPVADNDLVNKIYVDTIASGFQFKASCIAGTTTTLNTTYNNGASGVGATLTSNVNGAISIDGVSLGLADRVLVKDQTSTFQNGIYTVSSVGDASNPFVLTRATDFDNPSEIQPGSITFIQRGSTLENTSFVETEPVISVGTSPIVFVQFSQQYPLSIGNGGTGASLTPIANAVFSTNGSSVGQLSTILPSGLTIPGYARSGTNNDITSMTSLTGALRAPTGVLDANGNEVILFGSVASAVNELTLTNATTGNGPNLSATGGDTNIPLLFTTKGTGPLQFCSANTTSPIQLQSGTGLQHTTNFNVANTSASRTVTLQDADGTLAFLADRGMVEIQQITASNQATVEFTNLSGYTNYLVTFQAATPVTSGTSLYVQSSSNNGLSYYTSAGDYFQQQVGAVGSALSAASSLARTEASLSSNVISSVPGTFGYIMFTGFSNTTARKGYMSVATGINTSATIWYWTAVGNISPVASMNAMRFLFSAGNIGSGIFTLYGLK